nr:MAG TPA: hypothetical protein [Caudoviricetes sp.]
MSVIPKTNIRQKMYVVFQLKKFLLKQKQT